MNTPVNIEIAELLKEKGYDIPCYHYYYKNKLDSSSKDNWNDLNGYSAPTIAEVVMWLYEKYGVWIDVSLNQYSKPKDLQWMYSIVFTQDCTYSHSPKSFNSPTEAYEAAILYTLNNLI